MAFRMMGHKFRSASTIKLAFRPLSSQTMTLPSPSAGTTKDFYITTPIFYVNAKPHVGHLYTLVLTDVLRRHRLFNSETATMLTGTDEHGMKIQGAAKAANKDPQSFCDEVSAVFKELPAKAAVKYDRFIRTTDADHKKAVAYFWDVLEKNGYIYKASHSGWYSISDETFFPESATEDRLDHKTGRTTKVSIETGNVVNWTEEVNYHFRLSRMKDTLLEFYAENPRFIIPQARYNDVVNSVKAGLQDLSVSRPSSRLSWGIPVPGDSSQTIYVWLDALVNYLSAAGYPSAMPLWPADVHVIGKDIIRFHCIYWPAFLIAAGLSPPRAIVSHSHWTLGNHKMSKSRGNVVDPWLALERFGPDTVRYYLMRDGRLENDGDYSTEHVIRRHNHELVNGLGNLVARITGKSMNVNNVLASPPRVNDKLALRCQRRLIDCISSYQSAMSENHIYKAISEIVNIISEANLLLQTKEPWSKDCPPLVKAQTLYLASESARIAILCLQSVMPDACSKFLDRLSVGQSARTARYAKLGMDQDYRPSTEKGLHIFSPIDTGESPSVRKRNRNRLHDN